MMTKACALCGSRLEASACSNSLCKGFGKKSASLPKADKERVSLAVQPNAALPTDKLDPYDSPQGTTMPRHIAGVLDNLLAWFFSIVIAKQLLPEPTSWIPIAVLVLAYLGYFFVFEALFCTTPAKFINGLVVRDFGGGRCSVRQTFVRTIFRLIEVNPAIFGALPAAICILTSRNKQRLGDRVARTVVVMR